MAFTLWSLLEAGLLILNAVCILHEKRFLAKVGLSAASGSHGFGEQPGVKHQLLNLINSTKTVMRCRYPGCLALVKAIFSLIVFF
uniref:Immediate early response 3-interacting protein 1 n=1 Tax=Caligus clemensi TaxID=344056 RepID=C1C0Y4_CALCM|nr:Immediate early response 3-interacting protein 1 [Caligus clemensi]